MGISAKMIFNAKSIKEFQKIKKRFGLTNDMEVIRFCVRETFLNKELKE